MDDIYFDLLVKVLAACAVGSYVCWMSFFMMRLAREIIGINRRMDTHSSDIAYTIGSHRERIAILEARMEERSMRLSGIYAEEREEFWNPLNSTHPVPPPFISERKKPGRKPGSKNKPKEIAPEEIKNP